MVLEVLGWSRRVWEGLGRFRRVWRSGMVWEGLGGSAKVQEGLEGYGGLGRVWEGLGGSGRLIHPISITHEHKLYQRFRKMTSGLPRDCLAHDCLLIILLIISPTFLSGLRVWQCPVSYSQAEFCGAVRRVYPRLGSVVGFTVWILTENRKILERIPDEVSNQNYEKPILICLPQIIGYIVQLQAEA